MHTQNFIAIEQGEVEEFGRSLTATSYELGFMNATARAHALTPTLAPNFRRAGMPFQNQQRPGVCNHYL